MWSDFEFLRFWLSSLKGSGLAKSYPGFSWTVFYPGLARVGFWVFLVVWVPTWWVRTKFSIKTGMAKWLLEGVTEQVILWSQVQLGATFWCYKGPPTKSGLDPLTLQFSNLLVPTFRTLTCLISHSVLLSDRKESFSLVRVIILSMWVSLVTCEIDFEKNSDLFDFVHFIGMIRSSLVLFGFYDAPLPQLRDLWV